MEKKADTSAKENPQIKLTVLSKSGKVELLVDSGSNLREVLLQNGWTPYTRWTRKANCGGRGICATCGVWIENNEPAPVHWHDQLAFRYGYPRLSCQISLEKDMTIKMVDKIIWGKRRRRNK